MHESGQGRVFSEFHELCFNDDELSFDPPDYALVTQRLNAKNGFGQSSVFLQTQKITNPFYGDIKNTIHDRNKLILTIDLTKTLIY